MFENQDVQPNEKKLGLQAFILWIIIGVNAIVYIAKTKDIAGLFLPLVGMWAIVYGWSLIKGEFDELRQRKNCTVCVEAVVAEHRITPDDDELPALPVFSYEYDGKVCTGTLIGAMGMKRRHVRKKYPVGGKPIPFSAILSIQSRFR